MPDRTCTIEDCPNVHYARGWCMKHYTRWRSHGDPTIVKRRLQDYVVKPRPRCAVDGCDLIVHGLGYCNRHYRRLKSTGSVHLPNVIDRFWSRVNKGPHEAGCWLWTGTLTKSGYGQFSIKKRTVAAPHRFVYELEVGPIPNGLHIDHTCRNRACVNPAHLAAVTVIENSQRVFMDPEKHAALREVVRRPNVITLTDEVFALALSAAADAGVPVDRMVSDCITAVLAQQETRVA